MPFAAWLARGTSFQEPALSKHFQDQLFEWEVRGRADVAELVLPAIRFKLFAEMIVLRMVRRKQGWRDGDFPGLLTLRIDQHQLTPKVRLDFFMAGDMNDKNVMAEMPENVEGRLESIRIDEVRYHES